MPGKRILAATIVWAAACGDDGTGAPVDAGVILDAGPGDYHPERAGYVNVVEGPGLAVYALVQDGPERPVPAPIAQEGDCVVYRRPPPALCDPPCTDGVCEAPGTCVPWSQDVDAGTITVTGLKAPLRFERGEFGYEPTPFPPQDLFDDGDAITIAAPGAGGGIPGFSVALTGVAPLAGAPPTLALGDGRDLPVAWTPSGGDARVQLALVVGWHGAPYEAVLLCETDDDGSLVVPGAIVTALPGASNGLEQHLSSMMRFRRASVVGPHGPIEFLVGTQVVVNWTRGGAAR